MSISSKADRHLVEEIRILRSRLAKLEGGDHTFREPQQVPASETAVIDTITEDRSQGQLEQELYMRTNLLDNIPGCIAMILKKDTREIVASNQAAKDIGA
jgi:hypothetical protein